MSSPPKPPAWQWQRTRNPASGRPDGKSRDPAVDDDLAFLYQVYDHLHRQGVAPEVSISDEGAEPVATVNWRWVLSRQPLAALVWLLVGVLSLTLPSMIGIRWGSSALAAAIAGVLLGCAFWPEHWGVSPLWQMNLARPLAVFGLALLLATGLLMTLVPTWVAVSISLATGIVVAILAHRLITPAAWREAREQRRQRLATLSPPSR